MIFFNSLNECDCLFVATLNGPTTHDPYPPPLVSLEFFFFALLGMENIAIYHMLDRLCH